MTLSISITKRVRNRILTSGQAVKQTRFVLNYKEPGTEKRKQLFFERHVDAIAKRDELIKAVATGSYAPTARVNPTVAEAINNWLENRKPEVKKRTWETYNLLARKHVVGRLGLIKAAELTTAQIRSWHQALLTGIGSRTANLAKTYLGAALALAAEDFNLRVAAMPSRLGRGRPKAKKAILSPEQVAQVIRAAKLDPLGLYYAFPFLTGVRPSEQLGLLWEKVDFAVGIIRIEAMLERDGTLCEVTKTIAGRRDIPMGPLLRQLLEDWKERCPRVEGQLAFVFPTRSGKGHLYWNFRRRYWKSGLARAGVPYVSPHSARHAFISTMQAQGFEVGLVAKLAGHTPAVSVGHYTQAVRGGDAAMQALEKAYGAPAQ